MKRCCLWLIAWMIVQCTLNGAELARLPKASELKWTLPQEAQIEEREGRRILRVTAAAQDAKYWTVFATASVDVTGWGGKNVNFVAKARLISGDCSDNGLSGITVGYRETSTLDTIEMTKAYPPPGTFDWTVLMSGDVIYPSAEHIELCLGVRNFAGTAEFDLDSLELYEYRGPRLPQKTVTAELQADMMLLRKRILAMVSGDAEKSTMSKAALEELRARQLPDGSFQGINYMDRKRTGWEPSIHCNKMDQMALAWAREDSELYHDAVLADTLLKALRFWTQRRPFCLNWWFNDLSVPRQFGHILLLAPELFADNPELFEDCKAIARKRVQINSTGDNLTFETQNSLMAALLDENVSWAEHAIAILQQELRLVSTDGKLLFTNGLRADGVYQMHGAQVQFGNYGLSFLNSMSHLATQFAGTRWQLNDRHWELIHLMAFDGYQWILWKGQMLCNVMGRQLGPNVPAKKGAWTLSTLSRLAKVDPEGPARYEAVIARNQPDAPNDFVGNRHFWNSDVMAHRRPEWMAVVRGCSVRTRPCEDNINWDNSLGRFLSDGTCLVVRHGNEYLNITGAWDWTRLPGTTLPANSIKEFLPRYRSTLSQDGRPRLQGETAFTGGVTNGSQGVAVYTMDTDGVTARKAYFFDDDAIYELGAGIDSTSPYPVATTVNCCLHRGEVSQGDGWVHHDGIGYVGKGLAATMGERTGDWMQVQGSLTQSKPCTLDLFTVGIDHGTNCSGASYSVGIFPGDTPQQTATRDLSCVLRNTPELQAVRLSNRGIAAVFHTSGELGEFRTEAPGVFLIGADTVFAADPTQTLEELRVSLRGVSKTLALPRGLMAGSTVSASWN